MAFVIAVAMSKGGSGKTTTAVQLASYAAKLDGRKTLLADFDHQGQAGKSIGVPPSNGVFDHFIIGNIGAKSTEIENLDILTGSTRNRVVERTAEAERWKMERELMEGLFGEYEVVVIDTHPSGWFQEFAVAISDLVIIPSPLDFMAANRVGFTLAMLDTLGTHSNFYILPVMDDHTVESRDTKAALIESYGDTVLSAIPRRTALREAPGYGECIFDYAARNDAAIAYEELGAIVLGGV